MAQRLLKLELVAWSTGLLCVAALLWIGGEASRAEHSSRHLMPAVHASSQTPVSSSHPEDDLATFDGVIGRLELPALGLHVPILNNYDANSLRKGIGRVRGTAVPGGLGNFVVAGHRDTYFRPLRHISNGMTMRVITRQGNFDYIVDSTDIVDPSDVDVLDVGERPEMTLITCYPFDYIGAAPKRFIVHAHLVSVVGTP